MESHVATITAVPNGTGWGSVDLRGARRLCWFNPEYYRAPYKLPAVGQRVIVSAGVNGYVALRLLQGY